MTATLSQWIESSEDWLMWRILTYAKSYGHTKYTSTLEEAWRVSIQGLSQSVIQTLEFATEKLELGPDQNFAEDPVCASAIEEAACHRERGIDLKMFLGLFKNYRQTYIDRLTSGDEIGDRLNEHLESALGKIQESPSMSISTGWAHFDPEHHSCFEELLAEADADMYSSKRETGKAKTRS